MDDEGLSVRIYTEADREIVSPWYENGLVPADYLGTGFIVSRDGVDLAVGFLIQTETKLAIYEYMQTNTVVRSVYAKSRAVVFLTDYMLTYAKSLGFGALIGFTPSDKKSLLKMYDRIGCSLTPDHTIVSRRLDTWV